MQRKQARPEDGAWQNRQYLETGSCSKVIRVLCQHPRIYGMRVNCYGRTVSPNVRLHIATDKLLRRVLILIRLS